MVHQREDLELRPPQIDRPNPIGRIVLRRFKSVLSIATVPFSRSSSADVENDDFCGSMTVTE